MEKPTHRTMWMFPRNIRFIAPWKLNQIASLLYSATGDAGSQSVQDQLYDQLAQLGVKIGRSSTGIANAGGMRTYFAQLACLGLFWRDVDGSWKTTIAGDELIAARNPLKVIRCQLLRMQYPSVYGNGHNVQCAPEMCVKPFSFLVQLLQEDRLGRHLTCDDMAVAVVYGQSQKDYGTVVDKILQARESGFASIIDSVTDLCTPRRWNASDEELLQKGIEDARTIGNTAKNYLEAAQLIYPCSNEKSKTSYELVSDEKILIEIRPLLEEKLEPAPNAGYEAAWQRRFGRYNKTKDNRRIDGVTRVDSRTALLQSLFIRAVETSPYDFNVKAFCEHQAASWGVLVQDVARIVNPLVSRVSTVERNTVMAAALSGGTQAIVFEKAATAILRKLGFELSEHLGQKYAKHRDGGYPDIRIRSSLLASCGFGDTKATNKYVFPLTDTQKLGSYYHDCWKEFPDHTPTAWFLYIAGGFGSNSQTVKKKLKECADKYSHPVSAITVNALLDLADMKHPPSVEALARIFGRSEYITSASVF